MYISVEARDALCEAGAIVCAMFLIAAAIVVIVPWIVRKTRLKRRMMRVRLRLWMKYRRDMAQIRRAERRYKAAMKVFEKPVRWEEK